MVLIKNGKIHRHAMVDRILRSWTIVLDLWSFIKEGTIVMSFTDIAGDGLRILCIKSAPGTGVISLSLPVWSGAFSPQVTHDICWRLAKSTPADLGFTT